MRYMDNWAITNMSKDLIIEIIILGHNNFKLIKKYAHFRAQI